MKIKFMIDTAEFVEDTSGVARGILWNSLAGI